MGLEVLCTRRDPLAAPRTGRLRSCMIWHRIRNFESFRMSHSMRPESSWRDRAEISGDDYGKRHTHECRDVSAT